MRSKEEAHDYRYFPEPDLPPLVIGDDWIERVTSDLPELPLARRARLIAQGLSEYDAGVLTAERDVADFYDAVVNFGAAPKKAANWIMSEPDARRALAENLADLIKLIDAGTISGRIAKDVLAKMVASGEPPQTIVEREGLLQVSDTSAIEAAVREIVDANPKQVEQYRAGKTQVLGFFVGQVMKKMQGKANPALVNEVLRRILG
jgi:aspartyl-tRNA(Asn)/glutamyl-tRNA(Gln) amidotransferase subunit B